MPDTAERAPALIDLVRSGNLDLLEKQWLEEMESPGELPAYLEILRFMLDDKQAERVDAMAGFLVQSLVKHEREADTLEVYETLATGRLSNFSTLQQGAGALLKERYGKESWFAFLVERAKLDLEAPSWKQFCEFHSELSFIPGSPILHRAGWGEGLVDDLDPETGELTINFVEGPNRDLPFQSAVDTLQPLPVWDLRAMKLVDAEGLQDFVKKSPGLVIRRTLRVFRGKATSTQVKDFLHGSIVASKSWTSWWKKAKAAAVEDPLVAVDGSASRPVFTLRKKALTLIDEASFELKHESTVVGIVRGVRAYLARATRDSDIEDLIAYAELRLRDLAMVEPATIESVEALLYLLELERIQFDEAKPLLLSFVGATAEDMSRLNFRPLLQFEDSEIQGKALSLIPDLFGESWHEIVAPLVKSLPDDGLEDLIERFAKDAPVDRLLDVYESAAPFPRKHPFLLFLMTKAYADGAFKEASRPVDPKIVCRVIIHVLRVVTEGRKGNAEKTKLRNRVVTLLMGKRALLAELIDSVDRQTMRSLVKVGLHAGDDYPAKVQELVERSAHARFPEMFEEKQPDFWEDENQIFCTQEGFDAFQSEFVQLRDVKIPENSKSIGAAASQGDLSENAEWDAALEEQRNLTQQASEMEERLKKAKKLTEIELPDGIVCPGTRVVIKDRSTGDEQSYRVLGPWDSVLGDDVISYRAPLAQGLLGSKVSDDVSIQLPTGERHVSVVSIEKLF